MGRACFDWDRFVSDHAARVLRIAMRILGRLADAEDVSQEVFRELFLVETTQGMRDPTALAVRLATVRSLDKLRRLARADCVTPLHDGDLTTTIGPPDEAVANELAGWLREAVTRLPPREAQVFSLIAIENTSREETAELLGISVAATSTALFVA